MHLLKASRLPPKATSTTLVREEVPYKKGPISKLFFGIYRKF
jgi:hypothetical protein